MVLGYNSPSRLRQETIKIGENHAKNKQSTSFVSLELTLLVTLNIVWNVLSMIWKLDLWLWRIFHFCGIYYSEIWILFLLNQAVPI